ncbi:MAG: hypothetical protein V7677_19030 [Motiliproteus sp.]
MKQAPRTEQCLSLRRWYYSRKARREASERANRKAMAAIRATLGHQAEEAS